MSAEATQAIAPPTPEAKPDKTTATEADAPAETEQTAGAGSVSTTEAPPEDGSAPVAPPEAEPAAHPVEPATPATPPQAAPAPPITLKFRLTKRRARLLALLLLLAFITAGITVQLRRPLPHAHLTTTVAQTVRLPGPKLSLPWPKSGSAEVMIEGLGRLGGIRATTAAPIGSVAKVMTAFLILKHHPLAGDDPGPKITVTADDVADYKSRIPSGQSLVKVIAGEKITERQALEALMLPSANNVAHMLGVWDAGDADAFVTSMNDAADELGMTRTKYTDPSGFLPTTVSTAADQVTLAREALQDPVFADIIAEGSATIPVAGKVKNYNHILGKDGVFGVKTGSTTEAGGNLVFASRLELDGKVLTIVGAVFNQPGEGTPAQLARVDKVVHKLLLTVRAAIHSYSILPAGPLGRITTAWGDEVTVSRASELKVIGWPGLSVPLTLTTTAPGAETRSGQVVGAVAVPSGVRVELRADGATSDPSLWWKLTRKP